MANKITVTSVGTTANVNATPDSARYYSDKSKEWAISEKLIDNEDYSSKYYANESKKQADISTAKTTEVVESGNTAVSNIESARDNALSAIGQTNGSGARGEAITAITNNKTSALTEISSKQNSAVSAISTQQTNAIKAVQNQQTSSVNTVKSTGQSYVDKCKAWASSPNVVEGGLYSAKYYAEMAQGKSDVTYETLRASRAYEDKGALLTDEQGFAEVAKYKHSTFDKSKFTVVGNPTITDDGVASGFGRSNYLSCDNISVNGNNWECTLDTIIYGNGVIVGTSINEEIARKTFEVAVYGNGLWLYIGDNTNKQQLSCLGITPNTRYIIKVGRLNSNYYIKIYNSSKTLINSSELPVTYEVNFISSLYFGVSNYSTFNGSIDLKHFSITVDGKEVFSGNKTGLDVIKPDNYTVVGNPTITDDGVASGFSDSNYIKTASSSIDVTKPFKIVCPFEYKSNATTGQQVIFQFDKTYKWVDACVFSGNTTDIRYYLALGASSTNVKTFISPVFSYGKYMIVFEWTGTQYIFTVLDESNTQIYHNTYTSSETIYQRDGVISCLFIGKCIANDAFLSLSAGSIDLNAFIIYVDGKLVYQPCLKIPYTQSKTGSKIVPAYARDRVIDLYEQEGKAGYYTIDEENKNFTLPMGEIYGMIGQRSLVSSTVTETNRVDIYSDKTCLICGNVATAGTINLPIELENNNYFITLSTSTKTATSFTTTATGDYILIGKVI